MKLIIVLNISVSSSSHTFFFFFKKRKNNFLCCLPPCDYLFSQLGLKELGVKQIPAVVYQHFYSKGVMQMTITLTPYLFIYYFKVVSTFVLQTLGQNHILINKNSVFRFWRVYFGLQKTMFIDYSLDYNLEFC